MGDDAWRWSTFQGSRTLVVAARTVTSTVRILECLPALLRGDARVTVVFAHDPTSAFSEGVADVLHDAGCRVLPWDRLGDIAPDLVLSASENIEVPDGDYPVLVLPHGVGFQKLVPDSRTPRTRLSGAVPDALLDTGRAWLATSHPDQERQLLAAHPKAAGHTLAVGDPCFDELLASRGHADAYKAALGVAAGQRLVLVSSTWGPTSLLGRAPELPARLLAALPCDEYRVAAVLHPNVWSAHGPWQIRTVQAAALDAGLLLVPPVHAWRSALVAADAVVGDHGSVTLYGAALGKPVLLGAYGSDAVPGTAVAHLARTAPRLDLDGDLGAQLAAALREPSSSASAEVARLAFAEPGRALPRLRAALYRLLGLPEPLGDVPSALVLPPPRAESRDVTSWAVTTSLADGARPVVDVRRSPAAVSRAAGDTAGGYTHLACDEAERDRRLSESASVLTAARPAPSAAAARRWTQDALCRFPGALLAASAVAGDGGEVVVGLRDGRAVVAATREASAPGLAAAVVYTCLRAGLPLETAVTLRLGTLPERHVTVRPASG
ncbi:hypothetical protein FH965_32590 [Streptomyces spectabilis]|uniref:Translation initiation factor 2 n=1 Tax=Streptomyces spectabilis TaxID=68270 RepID=A0A516RM19_STRST|nr:hypothetical protein FH965_32590 [Streptomyces spectabilis]